MNIRALSYALAVVAALLLLLILLAAWLIIRDRVDSPSVESTSQPTLVAVAPTTASASATPTASRELPPPLVQVLPTNTPPPSLTPAPTVPPTEAPPTVTETPTAPPPTATRPPVIVQPLPTATQPPPPPPPPPVDTRGLSATFSVEGSSFGTGQDIWFNFDVTNSTGNPVEFGMLGAYPKRDGVDRLAWFQGSWTNEVIPVNGLEWRDHINLNEPGSYTLRLAICFDSDANGCRGGAGNWVTLSPEIPIVVQ
jgi:hypothetical protein